MEQVGDAPAPTPVQRGSVGGNRALAPCCKLAPKAAVFTPGEFMYCMHVVYIWAMYTILEPVYVYMHIVTCKLYPSMHVYTYITPYINAHRAETVLLYCQHL